jgi:ubiquinone/menaquinone biosynthesis C-methylase UbiE
MSTKSSNSSDTLLAAKRAESWLTAERAESWRRGKRLRGEVFGPATEMMLDLANMRVGDRVLEVAAGTGDLAIMIARRVGPNGYVLATDISTSMLNVAAEAVRNAGLTNVETRVMDAENIELDADSFDAVICRMGLMLFSNPVKTLIGMHRVLKPAARVFALVWSTEEKNPYRGVPLAIVRRIGNNLTEEAGLRLFALGKPSVLEETFRAAGFIDVAVHTVPTQWRFPSTAEAVRFMKDSYPGLQHLMTQLSETERELAWTEIEQQLSQFEGPNGFEAPGEVLMGIGTK